MSNIEYYKNGKYGLMIHFGLYSLLGGEYKGDLDPIMRNGSNAITRFQIKKWKI